MSRKRQKAKFRQLSAIMIYNYVSSNNDVVFKLLKVIDLIMVFVHAKFWFQMTYSKICLKWTHAVPNVLSALGRYPP